MKFFSIIVPIYNIEEYIEECIESVLKQNFSDYEIVLIDDGSKDKSGKICDRYMKYEKIKVIHKENGGLSDARNAGLAIAEGKYIIFLDGDDTLHENCLEVLYKEIRNTRIELLAADFNIYGEKNNKQESDIKNIQVNNLNQLLNDLKEIPWSASRNVYRLDIIKDKKIKFEYGLIGAEDCDFFMKYIENITTINYTNNKIINYRTNRDNSITNTIGYNAIYGQLEVFSKYFNKYFYEGNKEIYEHFSCKYLNTISTIYNIKSKEEQNKIIKNINKNKIILKYARKPKYIAAKAVWKIFGYYKGSKILSYRM